MTSSAGELLVVCRGNVYRSPTAEHLLRHGLGEDGAIRVTSAGIRATVGQPVAPRVVALLAARGIDGSSARASRLDRDAVRRAGAVLVMTRSQRSAIVELEPAAVRRTFLLRQAAATLLASGHPLPGTSSVERLEALPRALADRRPLHSTADAEIADPSARPALLPDVFAQIDEAVRVLVCALSGTRPASISSGRVPL